jgi:hypothetical protein
MMEHGLGRLLLGIQLSSQTQESLRQRSMANYVSWSTSLHLLRYMVTRYETRTLESLLRPV